MRRCRGSKPCPGRSPTSGSSRQPNSKRAATSRTSSPGCPPRTTRASPRSRRTRGRPSTWKRSGSFPRSSPSTTKTHEKGTSYGTTPRGTTPRMVAASAKCCGATLRRLRRNWPRRNSSTLSASGRAKTSSPTCATTSTTCRTRPTSSCSGANANWTPRAGRWTRAPSRTPTQSRKATASYWCCAVTKARHSPLATSAQRRGSGSRSARPAGARQTPRRGPRSPAPPPKCGPGPKAPPESEKEEKSTRPPQSTSGRGSGEPRR
mmetsp:Transcript_28143/g.97350  ORF Transcript_28143/g.97350 Transcript_28143/m.97350 type:complete len:263 (+) Transcript_28143:520-1308(+)